MYLHLGADCVVKSSDIVGIFSLLDKKANIYEEFVRPNLGKYKVVDNNSVTYLTIKNSEFHGKIYIYDKESNRLLSESGFKNGIADGKWIEYDKNERPVSIDYLKNDYIMKRENFVNGKLIITKTFKDGLYRLP